MIEQMNQYLAVAWGLICGLIVLLIVLDFIRWSRLNKQLKKIADAVSRLDSKNPTGCVICGKENFVRPDVEEDGVASILCKNCLHEYRIEGNQFEIRSKGPEVHEKVHKES